MRAVFLDRDKTLNEDPGYLSDPTAMRLLPGVLEGLSSLQARGLRLVLISNQAGVGRGYFSEATMWAVHARLEQLLAADGVHLDAAYYCQHAPWDGCACRKPQPGMLLQAARELNIDLAASFMVGDKLADVEAGRHAKCATILIRATPLDSPSTFADVVCADLVAAAAWIAARVS